MTVNGVMALILRYFIEFVYDVVVCSKSSRSLSHLLMSFLLSLYCIHYLFHSLHVRLLTVTINQSNEIC